MTRNPATTREHVAPVALGGTEGSGLAALERGGRRRLVRLGPSARRGETGRWSLGDDDRIEPQEVGRDPRERGGTVRSDRLVADEVECAGDVVGRRQPGTVMRRRVAQDAVADGVELARHPGPDLPWPEQPAVLGGCGPELVDVRAGPAADEAGVQQLAERVDVEALVRLQVVDRVLVPGRGERRCHAEPDHPHRARLLEQHVVGGEPAVVDAALVRMGDGLGDLGHDPGRARVRQRRLGEQLIEGEGPGPLADDEVLAVIVLDEVEHAQEPGIGDRRGQTGRLDEVVGPRIGCSGSISMPTLRLRMLSFARQVTEPSRSVTRSWSS